MEVLIHLCLIYLTTICDHSNTNTLHGDPNQLHTEGGKIGYMTETCQKSLKTFRQSWIFDFMNIGVSTNTWLL